MKMTLTLMITYGSLGKGDGNELECLIWVPLPNAGRCGQVCNNEGFYSWIRLKVNDNLL